MFFFHLVTRKKFFIDFFPPSDPNKKFIKKILWPVKKNIFLSWQPVQQNYDYPLKYDWTISKIERSNLFLIYFLYFYFFKFLFSLSICDEMEKVFSKFSTCILIVVCLKP